MVVGGVEQDRPGAVAGEHRGDVLVALDFGVGPVQAVLLGAITGIGGGILRDVLLREVPAVLRHDLYAIPALLGAGVLVAAQEGGSDNPVFPALGVVLCVAVRLAGLKFGVSVPIAPSERRQDRPPADGP